MNTIINANGFEVEVSEGLNDVFVRVTNNKGEVISDMQFDHETTLNQDTNVARAKVANSGVLVKREASMEEWKEANEKIQSRVTHLKHVIYSAYELDAIGRPIDNLDQTAIDGAECHIFYDLGWVQDENGGMPFKGVVLNNPTWMELCVVANDAIEVTGDKHHVYFESVVWDEERCGYQLRMGS